MENPKVVEIVSKYGRGFEEYYFDGKADGIEQRNSEIASILLVKGVDESIISESTSLSIDQIKQLKRKL